MELWVTRDPNGELKLFGIKPEFDDFLDTWMVFGGYGFIGYLDENEMKEVTFDNSPMAVEMKPK